MCLPSIVRDQSHIPGLLQGNLQLTMMSVSILAQKVFSSKWKVKNYQRTQELTPIKL